MVIAQHSRVIFPFDRINDIDKGKGMTGDRKWDWAGREEEEKE